MLAAVLHDFDRLVLEDVPIPEPGLGEVVVRIKACGICATDYKAIKGIRRNVTFPFIAGHEPCGQVVKTGPGCRRFGEGDRVIQFREALREGQTLTAADSLLVEVGGGSADLSFLRKGEPIYSGTYALGAIRMRQSLASWHGSHEQRVRLFRRHVQNIVEDIRRQLALPRFVTLVLAQRLT